MPHATGEAEATIDHERCRRMQQVDHPFINLEVLEEAKVQT